MNANQPEEEKKGGCRCGEGRILRAMFGPEYETDHDLKRAEGRKENGNRG